MPPILLYSTNVFLKYLINEQYRGGVHYVWCSECFDATKANKYSPSSLTAPSPDPADLYRRLKTDVQRGDWHSSKITEQKASLRALAIKWEAGGDVTRDQRDDIIYLVDNASFDVWRPLVYLIPRHLVESRLKTVPMSKRASLGVEYIVEDLRTGEFDIIEL